MRKSRRFTLYGLTAAMALAIGAAPAFAGGDIDYVRANTGVLQQGETYDQFVVKYRDGAREKTSSAALLRSVNSAAARVVPPRAGAGMMRAAPLQARHERRLAVGADVVSFPQRLDYVQSKALIEQIAADPNVEYVEPVMRLQRLDVPNDTYWEEQWGLHTPAESGGGINLAPALSKATGEGVVVAVLDTGVTEHPDLSANVLFEEGYDFYDRVPGGYDPGDYLDGSEGCGPPAPSSWHGTHVAGTVAAVTNNNMGVASVAPGSAVLPVRVLGNCGGYSGDIADAIMWASGGSVPETPANQFKADVINMSLGGTAPAACPNVFKDALAYAHDQGVTVVVAAGNSDSDVTSENGVGRTMGNCSADLVVVGGVGPTGRRGGLTNSGQAEPGWGSSHGARVDVAAPMGSGWSPAEDQVLSTTNTGATVPESPAYSFGYGTSMASPHVAGLAALVISASEADLTPDEVKQIIKETTRPFPITPDKPIGTGIIDANAAVDYAIEGPPEPCDPEVEQCEPDATFIQNKQPVRGLSGTAGSETLYAIEVPEGVTGPLSIVTSGGRGDVSLYVSLDEEPSADDADWRSTRPGNNEVVRVNNPEAGTYYIKLVGVRDYSNLTLQARFEEPENGGPGCNELENGVPVTGISGDPQSEQFWTINVPAGTPTLTVAMAGGTGDADLYVRYGAQPTTTDWACRPYQFGNEETCTISNPTAGTWHVMIRGFSAFEGVSLTGSY